ncbi:MULTISPECIES: YbaB/EbfC family DNA-binding protein [unclassified Mycobacterium]|uniref:YbaB/EbfC family DNA-binding protein n=1 Tax=unclassified Mycobacterium TaxID=2642494 RepID=UPI0029C6AAB5|nr:MULTISPECIES: YbaB/EbfC family DNA-binding protein [unclassified Mycobacterium]
MARDGSWDDDDDLGEYASSLDALASFAAPIADGISEAEEGLTVLFTVENPARTVSATALVGGQIQHIGLTNVTAMTEREVSEEIKVVANLAARKAQSAQHAVVVELMHTMGHDRLMTGSFLEREIGLPSPESVNDIIAQSFSTRRSPDGDWV